MKPTYHIVELVPKDPNLNLIVCSVLKKEDDKVGMLGATYERGNGDGYDYLRALGVKINFFHYFTRERYIQSEEFAKTVALWYLGMQKPSKFFGNEPVEYDRDALKPPFNYSLPCPEFQIGKDPFLVQSLERNPLATLCKKILTFGDYKPPTEYFENGFKTIVDFWTSVAVDEQIFETKQSGIIPLYSKNPLIPHDIPLEELVRKRREVFGPKNNRIRTY